MAQTIAELQDQAQALLDDMLETEIATWAKGVLRDRIIKDIYDVYTPKDNGWVISTPGGLRRATYERRKDLPRLVYSEMRGSGRLFVTSSAQKSTSVYKSKRYPVRAGDFLELIQGDITKPNGGLGVWHKGFPRPAVSIAQYIVNKNLPTIVKRLWASRTGI